MITAEEMRAVVKRHADEVPDGRSDLMAWHSRHAQAHADRGALLDLLRQMDLIKPIERGGWICASCGAETASTGRDELHHASDCPAPLLRDLEALR